ncbi:MAG: alpha-amylase/4-alpha-glucanotransferase domain-containing protein, partial [Candidatus Margulisiibacteriota bacterium]
LLSQLEANSDWIEFTTFSNYLDEYPPKGRIYLPTTSYNEMMKWSLPAASGREGGGYFRNFFVKYPEANNLHKKMLHVSNRLKTLSKGKTLIGGHKKIAELEKAKQELYMGQCSCAYWHGMFGGLYLNYLRHAIYSHLIRSEIEMEKLNRAGKPFVELTLTDIDKDGQDEVILANSMLNLYFSPQRGGSLFELDYKPKAFNLINTLVKHQEDYHEDPLASDGQPRVSLLDHFFGPEATLESFSVTGDGEVGDFVQGSYDLMPRRKESEVGLRLSRNGSVAGSPLKVEKIVSLCSKQSIFTVEYEVSNLGDEPDEFWFGVEFNFSMLAGNSPDRYYIIEKRDLEDSSLASAGEEEAVGSLKLVDEWSGFDVLLEMSKPALLWRFPIETISRSEAGLEKTYQSSAVVPGWKFRLGPKDSWKVKITLRIEE